MPLHFLKHLKQKKKLSDLTEKVISDVYKQVPEGKAEILRFFNYSIDEKKAGEIFTYAYLHHSLLEKKKGALIRRSLNKRFLGIINDEQHKLILNYLNGLSLARYFGWKMTPTDDMNSYLFKRM